MQIEGVLETPPEQRRTLIVLVMAQLLSGAGLAAGITVGGLLVEDMLDSTRMAGVPIALITGGSALAAVAIGRISERRGRRVGLAAGYFTGAIGALGIIVAAAADNIGALFLAMVIYGAGSATNLQARYAGADLAPSERKGQAVSTVLVATTIGAVAGPNLVTAMGNLAEQWDLPRLSGPFILAGIAYALAALVLFRFLRPDPLLLARTRALDATTKPEAALTPPTGPNRSGMTPLQARQLRIGALVMVMSQFVMVAIMTMTPIHMTHHGHSTGAAGLVIAIHVGAMYLPAPLSGYLVDRLGARIVNVMAAVTLLASGLLAAFAPTDTTAVLALALALLGIGWSFGLVSGTTVVSTAVPLERRARTQARIDVAVAIAGASGGAISGIIMSGSSYRMLSLAGALAALATVGPILSQRHLRVEPPTPLRSSHV